jgi:hypothetical protein
LTLGAGMAGIGKTGLLLDKKRVHIGANQDGGAAAVFITPTTPWACLSSSYLPTFSLTM